MGRFHEKYGYFTVIAPPQVEPGSPLFSLSFLLYLGCEDLKGVFAPQLGELNYCEVRLGSTHVSIVEPESPLLSLPFLFFF